MVMKLKNRFQNAFCNESGGVSVEWVVIIAVVIAIAIGLFQIRDVLKTKIGEAKDWIENTLSFQ